MKPSLQVRISQHLALTPQLQQSIRLLQMSTLELQLEVGQMLEANPFLEVEEEAASPFEQSLDSASAALAPAERQREREAEEAYAGADGVGDGMVDAVGEGTASLAVADADGAPALAENDFGTTERDDWENGTERDDFDGIRELPSSQAAASGDNEDGDPFERDSSALSLAEHLQAQLAGMRLAPEDRAAVQVLIESLDEDGYLADPLLDIACELARQFGLEEEEIEEWAQAVGGQQGPFGTGWRSAAHETDDTDGPMAVLAQRLLCALRWLQSLDPVGVGARDLAECLRLQLMAQTPCPEQELALKICDSHLDLLARRDVKKLLAATGADEEELRWAQGLIRGCEPKPGRAFSRSEGQVVIPDVLVQRAGRGYRVVLNPDVMPRLRINDLYAQALKGGGRGNASPLSSHLQEARWFMKNIQQRFETILRVSSAIAERQRNFFSHGEIAMKPLVLREIADELGLHESTISRVTTAKYIATPFGTFELKYFFGSGLSTETGGNASSTAVRALIKQLVAAEDPKKPLSDSQLSDMLAEQGIQVARRTVAKYREALKIAPANLRKAV